nr:hypothetical protein [Tanacetum cinerariifolium]
MKKIIETVRFRNDDFGAIMGYGDYVIGDSVISRVYYMEGLGHNLLPVGTRGTNLYNIFVKDMMRSSPICLLSKASKNKSWLWHRRLNHLNFGTINDLAQKDLVRAFLDSNSKKIISAQLVNWEKQEVCPRTQNCQHHHGSSTHSSHGLMWTSEGVEY